MAANKSEWTNLMRRHRYNRSHVERESIIDAGSGDCRGAPWTDRGRHSDWRSSVRCEWECARRRTQPPRAKWGSFAARRDRRLSRRGPQKKLPRPDHGDNAGAVLVLQRTGAAIRFRHGDCGREPQLSRRHGVAALAGSESDRSRFRGMRFPAGRLHSRECRGLERRYRPGLTMASDGLKIIWTIPMWRELYNWRLIM